MKRAILILTFFFLNTAWFCHAAPKPQAANELTGEKDKISYTVGYDMGMQYKRILLNTNFESMLKGFRDAVTGNNPAIAKDQLEKIMQQFFRDLRKKEEAESKKSGEKNKKEGDAFLKGNALKEGVQTTKSGLQYKILREGTGPKPGANDTVSIHYKGYLIDGTEFHNSYKSGKPVSFPILKTFPGWSEALRMMNVGSKWEVFLPSDLAFGQEGLGNVVGPHAVVIFDLELIETKPADK
jgi:FKBP-type peptidyl-prolyl cis-trans isomerase FklB